MAKRAGRRRASGSQDGTFLRPHRISDSVASRLREMISAGTLQPGEKLPSERVLAQQLRVGRPTVREAIQRLEGLGLLEVRGPRGTYVRPVSPELFALPLKRALQREVALLVQIVDVRMALEGWVAAEAARSATAEDIARLQQLIDELEAAATRGDSLSELDVAFHLAVVRTTQNAVVLPMIEMFTSMIRSTRTVRNLMPPSGNSKALVDEHRSIVEAIARRDPEGAQRAMVAHLQAVRGMLLTVQLG